MYNIVTLKHTIQGKRIQGKARQASKVLYIPIPVTKSGKYKVHTCRSRDVKKKKSYYLLYVSFRSIL